MYPQMTEKAVKQQEEIFRLKNELENIFKLVVMEWKTDPTSVQCFDLRIVQRAKEIDAILRKKDIFYD